MANRGTQDTGHILAPVFTVKKAASKLFSQHKTPRLLASLWVIDRALMRPAKPPPTAMRTTINDQALTIASRIGL
jgi:hypothetical protein